MRKYFSKLTLAIVLALVMGLAFAGVAVADPPAPRAPLAPELQIMSITKDLNMPPGTTMPNAVFEFSMRQVVPNPDGPGYIPRDAQPAPIPAAPAAVPGMVNQTITFPADLVMTDGWSNIGQVGGATAPNGFDLGAINWPHAGQFFFVIEELRDTNPAIDNDPLRSLTYDSTAWLLLVTVINYDGGLHISKIQVASLNTVTDPTWNEGQGGQPGYYTGGTYVIIDKKDHYRPGVYVPGPDGTPGHWTIPPSDILFVNDYLSFTVPGNDDGTLADPALAISKEVVGELANQILQFNFTMNLDLPNSVLLPNWNLYGQDIVATITDSDGVPIPGRDPVVFAWPATTPAPWAAPSWTNVAFTLAHGEELRFPILPAGTVFSVTEAATPNYAASAVVITGANAPVNYGSNAAANVNIELSTGDHFVSDARGAGDPGPFLGNTAAFTNTDHTPEILGLFIGSMPFMVALIGATVLLAMMVASRSRQRIEQLPIAY